MTTAQAGERGIKTGDKVLDNLYNAVQKYVEKYNGSVVVIGGVALVQDSPLEHNFGLMVRCTGKNPVQEEPRRRDYA